MRTGSRLLWAATSAASRALLVIAQLSGDANSIVEPAEFNIEEALLQHGINVSGIPDLCSSLRFIYGDDAVETKDEAAYTDFFSLYWSTIQAEVRPYCIFKPFEPEHVSVVVLLSRLTQCPFAAKSGGHAAMAGASSIEGGITVSFTNMRGISLSADRKVASVQPGNVWGDVYQELTKYDVTVIGGRIYSVGVGGLTTGGGISFFSGLYGWACDNVDSYDVVIATGAIVRVTETSFPDLFWALRGGGNNFGLVVGFNFRTVPLPGGNMWGGSRTYTEEQFPRIAEAYANIIANAEEDPKAGLWHVYLYLNGTKLSPTTLYYAEPDGGDADIFSEWNTIPAVADTTRNRAVADYARENAENTPFGLREVFAVITTKADVEIVNLARDIYFEEVLAVADVPGIVPCLVAQGITVPMLKAMRRSGGNALGLDVEDGPFYILEVSVMWSDRGDDDAVYAFASAVLGRVNAEAKARGLDSDYVYMNYAAQFQDVVAGYGAENKARLKRIAKKYDPKEVFQKLQPGYFKLDRAPVSDPRPEDQFAELVKIDGRVDETAVAAVYDHLKPVSPELLVGQWEGGSFDTGHPTHQQLRNFKWAGKDFRSVDDVDPIMRYDKDGKRTWLSEYGHARVREVRFRGVVTASMVYDKFPIIDSFRYVDDNTVIGAMDNKDIRGFGTYYFYLRRRRPQSKV
ncbi:FAD binding domain-containing protein [Colletotrichum higginsianum IMI 349063]|uniref:FAD binding domain-containing protein n=2 Tax=Colletotrichum higginsianum (strain IMI 349063) TaxID=759273 RepID=A0A1B7Y4J1_COLHI|nr:FAD binding domain-containing protein [Colletotrichum higginsianum IMI 349063]OBR06959.1 FAD binding domain-containing protein [Colletotrichum higginsianum IMI 349063]